MQTGVVVAERRLAIAENVRDDAEVLLDHSRKAPFATDFGDPLRVVIERRGSLQITASLRDRAQTIERVRLTRFVVEPSRDLEAPLVQPFGDGCLTAISEHRPLPAQNVGEERRVFVGPEYRERLGV